jgi:hypothetical protein
MKNWNKYKFNIFITIIAVGGYFYGYENGVDVNKEKAEYYDQISWVATELLADSDSSAIPIFKKDTKDTVEYYTTYALSGEGNLTIWKTIKYNK